LELILEAMLDLFSQGIDIFVENFGVDGIGIGGIENLVVDGGDDFASKQLVTNLVVERLDLEIYLLLLLVFFLGLHSKLISHIEAHGWRERVVFDIVCKIDSVSKL